MTRPLDDEERLRIWADTLRLAQRLSTLVAATNLDADDDADLKWLHGRVTRLLGDVMRRRNGGQE